MHTPRLTVCFDNYPGEPGLRTLWGFAAVLDLPGQKILFDTGSNGRILLENMARLGQRPEDLDMLFLSHPHWDHIGGLDSVLELNTRLQVVVHEGFSKHLLRDLEEMCAQLTVIGRDMTLLAPGVRSTGLFDSNPPEHALILDTGEVTALITGCAHPGIDTLVQAAMQRLGRPVEWAIGGFHLMYSDDARIQQTLTALQDLGVTDVVPTHCTGDAARAAFQEAYGPHCHDGGVGQVIEIA
ncbi:MBL fold metallo-hydrolase [Ectothiorhodospira mobilis]|uniref:MBL fold metallo-hydrolase n=1 Tax=Ectothiorhodospira mobilis TaxID=195064 RepID=UPI001908FF5F|nr:MBL fold metallo-hydrolase [Ectothiorhodospira mobilis]MBK1690603.1 metal-dependent hydrolase [Ectothiorhodospira mobilis]